MIPDRSAESRDEKIAREAILFLDNGQPLKKGPQFENVEDVPSSTKESTEVQGGRLRFRRPTKV
jgi:hypothetical protein